MRNDWKPLKAAAAILPTPLYKLENLSAQLKSDVYIKRDDMTGMAFGGNKLRKLDYLVQEAKDAGYTTLLTFGGTQTNHGRQTAAVACKYGMKSVIIANMYDDAPPQSLSGNLLLDKILGCDVVFMDMASINRNKENKQPHEIKQEIAKLRKAVAKKVIEMYEAKGEKVYEMPAGGSTTTGVLGYFDCVEEILEQMKQKELKIDYVVCSSGSNATYAGLWLGTKYYHAPFKVIGCTVNAYSWQYNVNMANLINATSDRFDLGVHAEPEDITLLGDYCGTAYDVPDEKTFENIYRLARSEGLFVDPCYTGKGFTGMMDLIETEKIPAGSNVLFIHTGGTPGLYSAQHVEMFNKQLWENEAHTVISMDIDELD